MNPIAAAVHRPYTVAVVVILAVLFSAMAAIRIPVQLKPTVDAPVISVRTIYRGASPVEVEEQITREIEDLLQGVDGLERLTSSSTEGVSAVALEYRWGVDKERAVVDVINKLNDREFTRSADPQVTTRIAQYEMAYRMQTSIPDLIDLSDEPN